MEFLESQSAASSAFSEIHVRRSGRSFERKSVAASWILFYFPCDDPSPHELPLSLPSLSSLPSDAVCIQKHSTCPLLFDLTQLIFNRVSFHRFSSRRNSESIIGCYAPSLALLHEGSQIGKRLGEPDRQNVKYSFVFLLMCTRWGLL